MRVNIKMTRRTAKVSSIGQVVMFIKEDMRMTLDMDMEKCIGLMEVCIKGSGIKGFNMGKER